jgi:hypothetical protein
MPTVTLMSMGGNVIEVIQFNDITTYYNLIPIHLKKDCAISLLDGTNKINLFDNIKLEDIKLTLVIYKNTIDIKFPIEKDDETDICLATHNGRELWKIYIESHEYYDDLSYHCTSNFIIFNMSYYHSAYILINSNGEPFNYPEIVTKYTAYSDDENIDTNEIYRYYNWNECENYSVFLSYNHHELVLFTENSIELFYFDNQECKLYEEIEISPDINSRSFFPSLKCISCDNKLYCIASRKNQYLLYDKIEKQYKYHEIEELYQGAYRFNDIITTKIKNIIAKDTLIIIEYVRIQTHIPNYECRNYEPISELLEDHEYVEYVFKSYIRATYNNINSHNSIEILKEEYVIYGCTA